jgi:hypothetical protein
MWWDGRVTGVCVCLCVGGGGTIVDLLWGILEFKEARASPLKRHRTFRLVRLARDPVLRVSYKTLS